MTSQRWRDERYKRAHAPCCHRWPWQTCLTLWRGRTRSPRHPHASPRPSGPPRSHHSHQRLTQMMTRRCRRPPRAWGPSSRGYGTPAPRRRLRPGSRRRRREAAQEHAILPLAWCQSGACYGRQLQRGGAQRGGANDDSSFPSPSGTRARTHGQRPHSAKEHATRVVYHILQAPGEAHTHVSRRSRGHTTVRQVPHTLPAPENTVMEPSPPPVTSATRPSPLETSTIDVTPPAQEYIEFCSTPVLTCHRHPHASLITD